MGYVWICNILYDSVWVTPTPPHTPHTPHLRGDTWTYTYIQIPPGRGWRPGVSHVTNALASFGDGKNNTYMTS